MEKIKLNTIEEAIADAEASKNAYLSYVKENEKTML